MANKSKFIGAKVFLNQIDVLKKFVNVTSSLDCDLDLVSGRYVIDAKSIMGIFSLDLSKPIEINIYSEDKNILKQLEEFIVE